MPLSAVEKKKIKQSVNTQLEEFERQLEMAGESSKTVELDQALAGRVSRIDAIQQQKIAEAGLNRAKIKIARLTRTLEQLCSEEFGNCEECGDEIGLARLLIKPESINCVTCQGKME